MNFLGTDEDRTRDLRFTRPTPYHLATAPHSPPRIDKLLNKITKPSVASYYSDDISIVNI